MNILGIPGSLRRGSFNRALLDTASELVPAGVRLTIHSLDGVPVYDEDLKRQRIPDEVSALGRGIAEADAVLIATPEYNYSIPGVLKNAIDWLSRLDPQPFDGKPIAIMGASPGRLGTARAQYHLRQVFVFLNAYVLNRPEIMVAGAGNLIDDSGHLGDEATRKLMASQLEALVAHARRVAT